MTVNRALHCSLQLNYMQFVSSLVSVTDGKSLLKVRAIIYGSSFEYTQDISQLKRTDNVTP